MKPVDDTAHLGNQEGPRVEQADLVHHDDEDRVPALQATRLRVLYEEGV